jgi:hypothetical protein
VERGVTLAELMVLLHDADATCAVTTLVARSMFRNSSFNGNLGSWVNVTDMSNMFDSTNRFNQVLPALDTGRVFVCESF